MMACHLILNMEMGIFDIYFLHTIENRVCSYLFFWILGYIYSILHDLPYHGYSDITIDNQIFGYSILAATDPAHVVNCMLMHNVHWGGHDSWDEVLLLMEK